MTGDFIPAGDGVLLDGVGCEDCSIVGFVDPMNDGDDFDMDGICDFGDFDFDFDGALDEFDSDPYDSFVCADEDNDGCDDCSISGFFDPLIDGDDYDMDGICDSGEADDENDGVEEIKLKKLAVWPQEINGILYYIDEYKNIYKTEDLVCNKLNPNVIAKYC